MGEKVPKYFFWLIIPFKICEQAFTVCRQCPRSQRLPGQIFFENIKFNLFFTFIVIVFTFFKSKIIYRVSA